MKSTLKIAALSLAALIATPASAQVTNIATATPLLAIANTKSLAAAHQQIGTTYKASIDQIGPLVQQRQTFLVQLDKNKDQQLSDAELKAAKAAKSPALAQASKIEERINQLRTPAYAAQLYALETLLRSYDAAQAKVVADRHVGALLSPNAFLSVPPAADLTAAITAELDRSVPTLPTTPPANWQPAQSTLQVQQQIDELGEAMAARQAARQQQAPAAAPATAPAAPATTQPTGR